MPVIDAVKASCSIPIFMQATPVLSNTYIDGGTFRYTPVECLKNPRPIIVQRQSNTTKVVNNLLQLTIYLLSHITRKVDNHEPRTIHVDTPLKTHWYRGRGVNRRCVHKCFIHSYAQTWEQWRSIITASGSGSPTRGHRMGYTRARAHRPQQRLRQFGHELQRALHFLRQQYRTYKRSLIELIPRYEKMRLLSAIGGDMPDFDISKIHAVTYLASNYEKHFSIRWHEGGACWDGQRYVGCLPEGVLKRAQGLRRLEERDKYKGCLAVYWRECKEKVLQKHMDEFEQARQDAQTTLRPSGCGFVTCNR